MIYKSIDGVNYKKEIIQSKDGPLEVQGITIRALRKILEGQNDDAMVLYMAEGAPLGIKADVIFGGVAGAGISDNVVVLVGPEAVPMLRKFAMEEL